MRVQFYQHEGNKPMTTKQPIWKLIANLGDVNPLDYGGYFVYVDETGTYTQEAELLEVPDIEPEDESAEVYVTRRFSLDQCTWENGVLSDNRFHKDHAAWFAKPESERVERPQDTTYLKEVAEFVGMPEDELRELFCSDNPIERAHAYRAVGDYHGWDNFDSYPMTWTRKQLEERYKGESK